MKNLKKYIVLLLVMALSQAPIEAFAKRKTHLPHYKHHKKLTRILHKTKHHIPKATKGRKRKNELSAIGRGAQGSKVHY